ncbi:MAG: MarR family transcriptional regulator [Actinobacteria bacterium]|nr:MarR family transcriptional regulator [Actinomycetota bacterium]
MTFERKKIIEEIISKIYSLRQRIMSELQLLFKEMGITHTQMMVLRIIQDNENMNLKDLAGVLGTTSSATTQIVNGLVKKGYLTRKRNTSDRRILNLALTENAKLGLSSVRDKSFSQLYFIFDVLNDEELENYCKLSEKIIGSSIEGIISRKDKD